MNEPGPVIAGNTADQHPVFISYATVDRTDALTICDALESQGISCWIACRDVEPGDNYQEAIVRAIRAAPSMVLIFTGAANSSDEIKKELSLASRCHIPVIALRMEDVEPSDAFAYELATRQWINAFDGIDQSIGVLAKQLQQALPDAIAPQPSRSRSRLVTRRVPKGQRWRLLIGLLTALLVAAGIAAWLLLRPASGAPTTQVRLADFDRLSEDVPAMLPAALRDEMIAAFANDGVVSISTAHGPPAGSTPGYLLGGTVRRQGDQIKVIARLANERSGLTLWSHAFAFDAKDAEFVPRRIAIDAGNLVRCGLFGASTYGKPLADPVLANYFQACGNVGIIEREPEKALDAARKVVRAVPDFSWGWSAVELAALASINPGQGVEQRNAFRSEALAAADKAITLDPSNSEALAYKSLLIGDQQFVERERLLKRALKARPLACGCEHHIYGEFLTEVGRIENAADEFQRSINVLPLNADSQYALGLMLTSLGRSAQAKRHVDAAIELQTDPEARNQLTVMLAPFTGDYATAEKLISNPDAPMPDQLRAALLAAVRAIQSGNAVAKKKAAAQLLALPDRYKGGLAIGLLGALGANQDALTIVESASTRGRQGITSWLFVPSLAQARRDPAFIATAGRLGLVSYWRTTRTKPDLCLAKSAPIFCKSF